MLEFVKLQLLSDPYVHALRVIGQDLAELFPDSLTIEMIGNNFVDRGYGKVPVAAQKDDEERLILCALAEIHPLACQRRLFPVRVRAHVHPRCDQ